MVPHLNQNIPLSPSSIRILLQDNLPGKSQREEPMVISIITRFPLQCLNLLKRFGECRDRVWAIGVGHEFLERLGFEPYRGLPFLRDDWRIRVLLDTGRKKGSGGGDRWYAKVVSEKS